MRVAEMGGERVTSRGRAVTTGRLSTSSFACSRFEIIHAWSHRRQARPSILYHGAARKIDRGELRVASAASVSPRPTGNGSLLREYLERCYPRAVRLAGRRSSSSSNAAKHPAR